MARIGEHGLREHELGLGQRIRSKPGKRRRPVIGGVEAVGIGVPEAGNHRLGACILDPPVEPKRQQIAALIECLDGLSLVLVHEELLRSQEVANLFCNGTIGGIKRSE